MDERDPHAKRRELVDKSGYPFQLAVEEEVKKIEELHQWTVAGAEVPHSGGFVDLVLQRNYLVAALECKREAKQEWVFLVEDDGTDIGRSRDNMIQCRWEYWEGGDHRPEQRIQVKEFWFCEGTYESNSCIVRRDQGRVKTLEPICQELIRAMREIINLELVDHGTNRTEWLVPIIVTTAPLYVCVYDPKGLNLKTGELPQDATMQEVNCVRFRKTFLGMDETRVPERITLRRLVRAQERTVLVCHGSHVRSLLTSIAKAHGEV